MNRQELKLADRDGQIWMQLMAIRSNPSSNIINEEDTHNIIKKLGARNRTAAAAIFLEQARAARHNADLSFALTGK